MSIGIDFILKANTASFTAGVASVNNALKDTKKALREFDVGNGLKQALGVGGIIAAFRTTIGYAQELRDAMEDVGRIPDESIASVARYGDALDSLWKSVKSGAAFFLSAYTEMGEAIGSVINRIRGISAEQEKVAAQAQRDADKAEKSRDEAYKNAKAIKEKQVRDAERAAEKERQASEKRADDEFEALVKIGNAQRDLDEKRAKNAHDRMTTEAKIADTEAQMAKNAALLSDYKKAGALSAGDQLRVIELQNKQEDLGVQLAKEKLDVEKAITKEKEYQVTGGQFMTSANLSQASDEELAALRDKLADEAFSAQQRGRAQGGFPGSQIAFQLEEGTATANRNAVLRELDFRSNLRQADALGGEALARRTFQGDPLQFDRLYSQLVTGQSEQARQSNRLYDLLARRGIPVVPMQNPANTIPSAFINSTPGGG